MQRWVREGREEEGLGLEEEERGVFGTSAAAPSSMLASLATGQCGVGGRMLGSDLNTISLCGDRRTQKYTAVSPKQQIKTKSDIFSCEFYICLIRRKFQHKLVEQNT